MKTIFYDFDDAQKAFINPDDFVKAEPHFPELCVTTFSESIINKFAAMEGAREIGILESANGSLPIYEIQHKGRRIGFFLSRVGAPACVAGMEEIVAMGAKKIVMFGCCGVLNNAAVQNKIIVPVSAVRDEGTSYHYLAASEEVAMDIQAVQTLSSSLDKLQIPYVLGKTWTTDAIYRETPRQIAARKAQGCIVVEMECSAVLAAMRFRKIPFIPFLYGADNLDGTEWDIRDLKDGGLTHSEKYMLLAFECAVNM